MTATLTLDLIGTGAGSFSIHQNSDNYASAVATNVSSSSLLSGYSLTLDNATTTVRVYSTYDEDLNEGEYEYNIFLQAVKSKNAWAMDQVYVYGVKGAPLYVKEVE